ncbi:MAG: hypothetical protein LBB45_03360 [Methanobrevibacter sp.]|jgi:hypothetical protein|nr:hypothetical protein [Candidatus Methanovirga basalitermitum]
MNTSTNPNVPLIELLEDPQSDRDTHTIPRVIHINKEDWEKILNQEKIVNYNTIYVCVEARDWVMSPISLAYLFNLQSKTVYNKISKYYDNMDKWMIEKRSLNIRLRNLRDEVRVSRGVNRELTFFIAYNTDSKVSMNIQEFANHIIENYIYKKTDELSGKQTILNLPQMKLKAPNLKKETLQQIQNEVLNYKKDLYPKTGKAWTTKEEWEVVTMLKEDVVLDEIANYLDRSVKSSS